MPTATPPPPEIEHSISLDERLGAAAERVPVPGRPGHTVSASLAHVPSRVVALPSRMNMLFGTDEEDAPVLELKFEFLDDVEEDPKPGLVRESQGRYAVEMSVGEHTGRIYRMALKGVDFTDQSTHAVREGIDACFHDYVAYHKPSLQQQAILRSMAVLVAGLLPDLTKQVRDSLKK